MATKNAINNSAELITIDPGASGDSFVQFDINATGEFRIGVDDTDDSFRISQGSALGTNDTFVMTAAGERTMPLQPAFLALNSVADLNVSGDGTTVTVEFNTEIFDQGSDYDNTTDTFTAPVDGRYLFSAAVQTTGYDGTQTSLLIQIIASSGSFSMVACNPDNVRQAVGSAAVNIPGSILVDMDAADTAYVEFTASGGNKTVDISGNAVSRLTIFSGSLAV